MEKLNVMLSSIQWTLKRVTLLLSLFFLAGCAQKPALFLQEHIFNVPYVQHVKCCDDLRLGYRLIEEEKINQIASRSTNDKPSFFMHYLRLENLGKTSCAVQCLNTDIADWENKVGPYLYQSHKTSWWWTPGVLFCPTITTVLTALVAPSPGWGYALAIIVIPYSLLAGAGTFLFSFAQRSSCNEASHSVGATDLSSFVFVYDRVSSGDKEKKNIYTAGIPPYSTRHLIVFTDKKDGACLEMAVAQGDGRETKIIF